MNLRKIRNRMGVVVLGAMLLALGGIERLAQGDDLCGDTGIDGALVGGGIVNTYYQAPDGTVIPGATELGLGAASGAVATLKFGAMLLVIQMQDADINTQDDNRYGDGVQEVSPTPDLGSGTLHINGTGLYEYVIVSDGVTAFGTDVPDLAHVPIKGSGPGGGLLNTYTNAASTGASGQKRYQIVRVPQYSSVTLNSGLTALAWNGKTGGILVIDVRGDVNLNNATINITATGFRGGFGEKLSSGAVVPNTTYRQSTAISAFGNKAEGIAGTPRTMTGNVVNPEGEGYPFGSRARGAPGTAGGGGNPQDPNTNTDSSGGGGGGNGGTGGQGGNTGNSNDQIGGFGGGAFVLDGSVLPAWTAARVIMGGGGGSGTKNNSGNWSSGGTGGGILMIRANRFHRAVVTDTATFTADGEAGHDGNNNGGGGAGAGGTVILTSLTGTMDGVTINARGGDGGPAGTGVNKYGPGGGGGGGVILISGTGAVTHTEPGANGLTLGEAHGAGGGVVGSPTPGSVGNPLILPGDIPGAHGGAECQNFAAVDDPLYATPLNTPLVVAAPGVMSNDNMPAGATYAAVKDSDPNPVTEGSVTLNGDGSFTFTPVTGFTGPCQFTYHLDATPGGNSNIATVTITVGDNLPPTAVADSYSTSEDVPLNQAAPGVLANDTDPNGDTLHAVKDTNPAHGSVTLNDNGSFLYTPNGNYSGPDSFTYHCHDGNGGTSSIVTVSLTVTPVNDAPVAVADAYQAVKNTLLSVAAVNGVLLNDSDVDGDTLTAVLHTDVTHGVLVLNPDGSFDYTPAAGYLGPDSFTYCANDGSLNSNEVTVTLSVVASKHHRHFNAGYCGCTGLELLFPLGVAFLIRRMRDARSRRSPRSTK